MPSLRFIEPRCHPTDDVRATLAAWFAVAGSAGVPAGGFKIFRAEPNPRAVLELPLHDVKTDTAFAAIGHGTPCPYR
ncbi:hypothetical protein AGMMS49545_18980 [Betaproteobacteria bacterium]|nr:hypothetical protein AGMMS49545_18980 [Betaproteobacteria bacterium]GHU47319.1 hypothetical protein AGMMS50289_22330 [Betaproteobacteria bacterium]